jgi:putative DNA primase/helicase
MQPKIIVGPGGTPFTVFDDSIPRANGRNGKADREPTVNILPASAYSPKALRWIWDGWLARGKLHLLAGAAGTGKTTIAISIAATVSAGVRWPDGTAGDYGDVLIWSGEDDIADTLLPRLMAVGGNLDRVHFVDGFTDSHGKGRPFDPATDLQALAKAARQLPNLKLIILDPVVGVLGSIDSHRNTETRRGLQPVVDLAAEIGCCLLGITHFSKNTSGREPLERVAGSMAFGAVARGVLGTVKPADPDEPRRLVRVKANNGSDCGGFAYTLHRVAIPGHPDIIAQRTDWGEALEGSARELMAVEDGDADAAADAMAEAETFLAELLRDGPVATREIMAAAAAHGHTRRTLFRAKDGMGVKATKNGFEAGWSWQLPPPPKGANDGGEECQ